MINPQGQHPYDASIVHVWILKICCEKCYLLMDSSWVIRPAARNMQHEQLQPAAAWAAFVYRCSRTYSSSCIICLPSSHHSHFRLALLLYLKFRVSAPCTKTGFPFEIRFKCTAACALITSSAGSQSARMSHVSSRSPALARRLWANVVPAFVGSSNVWAIVAISSPALLPITEYRL